MITRSTPRPPHVREVVSGGQTGVDRAALDVARRLGLALGGWCPAGGWAEDLPEPPGVLALFPELRATASPDPEVRTRWNVRDSTASLVLTRATIESAGTTATVTAARDLDRPHLVVPLDEDAPGEALRWLVGLPRLVVLNIAGPRESQAPGIYLQAATFLEALLTELRRRSA